MSEILRDLESYHISRDFGFLPSSPPLEVLPSPYYNPWELIATDLPKFTTDGSLKERISVLPVLTTHLLSSEEAWRRAYVVLGFICNSYLFGTYPPEEVSIL
jgi:indoleamine 2,3-dioxygenase